MAEIEQEIERAEARRIMEQNWCAAERARSARRSRMAGRGLARTWAVHVRVNEGWAWAGWLTAPGRSAAWTFTPASDGHERKVFPGRFALHRALRHACWAAGLQPEKAEMAAIEQVDAFDPLHVDGRGWPVDPSGDLEPQ